MFVAKAPQHVRLDGCDIQPRFEVEVDVQRGGGHPRGRQCAGADDDSRARLGEALEKTCDSLGGIRLVEPVDENRGTCLPFLESGLELIFRVRDHTEALGDTLYNSEECLSRKIRCAVDRTQKRELGFGESSRRDLGR